MTAFPALNHVALTVRDLQVSGPWYRALFEAEPVLETRPAPRSGALSIRHLR